MQPFTKITGTVATMDRANVDTDQIIPKQFLKRIERTGFGEFLFFDWRYLEDGQPDPNFELNQSNVQGANILVTRRNFGSGSSREHAVWALEQYGFRCVIAPSFADIFYNNCFKNGVLPVQLSEHEVQQLFDASERDGFQLTVDLENQLVHDDEAIRFEFEIQESRRHAMLLGLDDIATTLQHADQILKYEREQGIC